MRRSSSAMQLHLSYEPLQSFHLDELATVLLHPAVYEHIEGSMPSIEHFKLGLERALNGPSASVKTQRWLNYLVRSRSGAMLGRLEATVHDSIIEVAFLFGPDHWGKGYATQSLRWLHSEIEYACGTSCFWATTVPANQRCRALLQRSGYVQAQDVFPVLYSYAPGDLVYKYVDAV